jgi:hypothetical protein
MDTVVVLAQKLGKCKPIFDNIPAMNPTQQHTTSMQDEAITTPNHHHMNVLKDGSINFFGLLK